MSSKVRKKKKQTKTNQILISVAIAIVIFVGLFFVMQALNNQNSPVTPPTDTSAVHTPATSTPDTSKPPETSRPDTTTQPSTSEPTTPATSEPTTTTQPDVTEPAKLDISKLTHDLFDGENAFIILNDNKPYFTKDEITTKSFESYGKLDSLGRCTMCWACVGKDLMPTENREDIKSVEPTGWRYNKKSNNNKYDWVDSKYIYNRCHLIGFQLTGENANKQNLITGTRYLNIDGMLAFENMIADAVRENGLHVMYRVTPVFIGNNLVCEGLVLEAYSVEDKGQTVEFCVFSPNVQPGVEIDYATGQNHAK